MSHIQSIYCVYLQLLVEFTELQRGSPTDGPSERLQAVEATSPQVVQLLGELVHLQHSRLQLNLLLLEQAAHVLDLRC